MVIHAQSVSQERLVVCCSFVSKLKKVKKVRPCSFVSKLKKVKKVRPIIELCSCLSRKNAFNDVDYSVSNQNRHT